MQTAEHVSARDLWLSQTADLDAARRSRIDALTAVAARLRQLADGTAATSRRSTGWRLRSLADECEVAAVTTAPVAPKYERHYEH